MTREVTCEAGDEHAITATARDEVNVERTMERS
jgi:hypothetical protein